jgi:hypothetical protein
MARMQNKMGLPPGLGVPAALQDKFKRANQQAQPYRNIVSNQHGPSVKTIGKGSLIYFNYLFWQHDPYPLVIVTDIFEGYIRGVNLHYLTFPYIKKILQPQVNLANCDNRSFSYYNIKDNQYIVNAFRTYKRMGIRSVKALDCAFILNVMASVRSMDPQEVENIRAAIQQQMRARVQPKAQELSGKYEGMMHQKPGFENVQPYPVLPAEQANIR